MSGGDTAVDAFSVVGNPVRAEIVRALGDARVEAGAPPVVSFSELRSRTDVDVDSSRFNYHLKRLLGRYVASVEDGYRMRAQGRELYQALRAGAFEASEDVDDVDAGFDCHYCGAGVAASVADDVVVVECPGCGHGYGHAGAPPGAVADGAVDFEQVAAFYHHRHLAFARGVCVTCGSSLETEFRLAAAAPYADPERRVLSVYRYCEHCGDQRHLTLGTAVLPKPAVVSFCREHGVDVLSTPLWELAFAATDRGVTVHSTDPWEASLVVEYDGDTLELVVDDDLSTLERRP